MNNINNCYLRKALISDAEVLLIWANDPETINNSFNRKEILPYEHMKWLNEKLNDQTCRLYIMTDGSHDLGQLRFDMSSSEAIISYSIAKPYRGIGYGRTIIKLAEIEAKKIAGVMALIAKVKISNIASCRIFKSENFITVALSADSITFCKKLI